MDGDDKLSFKAAIRKVFTKSNPSIHDTEQQNKQHVEQNNEAVCNSGENHHLLSKKELDCGNEMEGNKVSCRKELHSNARDETTIIAELKNVGFEIEDKLSLPSTSQPAVDSIVCMLEERLNIYDESVQYAKSIGDGNKTRRYGRAVKTLESLLESAKSGRAINEEEMPPVVNVPKHMTQRMPSTSGLAARRDEYKKAGVNAKFPCITAIMAGSGEIASKYTNTAKQYHQKSERSRDPRKAAVSNPSKRYQTKVDHTHRERHSDEIEKLIFYSRPLEGVVAVKVNSNEENKKSDQLVPQPAEYWDDILIWKEVSSS